VVEGGYCNTCGRAPAATAARPPAPIGGGGGASSTSPTYKMPNVGSPTRMPTLRPASLRTKPLGRLSSGRTDSGRSSSRRTSSTRLGLGLVDLPPIPTGDPADAIMAVAEVPEDKRFCSHCDKPVGRSRNNRPGRTEGFCPHCRSHFSFTPKLQAGDLLARQYEVLGALAHGGLGWIYLARDKAVSDRWVVLKGLLDAASEDAALAAVAEQRFLAAIDHANIVQIYNFVTHEGAGYIVMEYVGGKSLKTLLKERRDANGGTIDPLPVNEAVAYVLGILPAMAYLHDAGLVYCDMKPDNVVLSGDSLKIIDLGGVRRIDDDDAAIYGTVGYQAPEVAQVGPSPTSDLYTVGRTLAVLTLDFRGYQSRYVDALPPPNEHPLLAQYESLHRFLLKATAADPGDRFGTAEEMAEQLLGVLREDAASRGEAHPAVSSVFGPDVLLLADHHDVFRPDWHQLPAPKVDPLDPGAGYLLGLPDDQPLDVAATLTHALSSGDVADTIEPRLRLARAQLGYGAGQVARETLDRLGDLRDWRLWWNRGLVALAEGNPSDAIDWLDPVYTDLPGEVAPKLALALAHELARDLARAAELYDRASRSDPSYVSGAFGLSRVQLLLADRPAAVEALARVPRASSAYTTARVATVRALSARLGDTDGRGTTTGVVSHPDPDELVRASSLLETLELEPRRRAFLDLELFEAGLFTLAETGSPLDRPVVLGYELNEPALREGLETTYRQLARQATSTRERIHLVDSANRVRPRTLW
jgi:serine/threonine-protein kinase PknG